MTSDLELLEQTARRIFTEVTRDDRSRTGRLPLDGNLWTILGATGLDRLGMPTEDDGTLIETAMIIRLAAEYSAAVPLAETQLLGVWVLHEVALPIPSGSLTAAFTTHLQSQRTSTGYKVKGSALKVPWGSQVRTIVLVGRSETDLMVVALPVQCGDWEDGTNLAGESRDDVIFDVELRDDQVGIASSSVSTEFARRITFARALMLLGAGDRALSITIDHVRDRVQFGRPLAQFQVVQHHVVRMASEVIATRAACDVMVANCLEFGFTCDSSRFAVVAAKAQANRMANVVARGSHQLLGATGFTLEHALHLPTTRLWAWQQEGGDAAACYDEIGSLALDAEDVWRLIAK